MQLHDVDQLQRQTGGVHKPAPLETPLLRRIHELRALATIRPTDCLLVSALTPKPRRHPNLGQQPHGAERILTSSVHARLHHIQECCLNVTLWHKK